MSAFWKDLFREIKNTAGRFISLIIITALGAASVVGIQAASIDMRAIADKTYKEHNLYDLQLKSATGFDGNDIAALAGTAGVAALMPTFIYDVFLSIETEKQPIRTYALPGNLNTIDLLEGCLPQNPGECLVERRLLEDANLQIGDTIKLSLDDMSIYSGIFCDDTFTVAGVVSSPLYISLQRGATALGNGSLRYYLYLHPDAYLPDIFTDVYLLMDGSHDMNNLTADYYAAADGWKLLVEETGKAQVQAKKDELTEAQRKLDEGWAEYADALRELEEKIAAGRLELAQAKAKLDEAKLELEDAQARLEEARGLLEEALAGLALLGPPGLDPELDAQYEQVYAALRELEVKQAEIDAGWDEYHAGLDEYHAGLLTLENEEAEARAKLTEAKSELEEAQEKLDGAPAPEWFYFTRKSGLNFDSYYQDTLRLEKIGYIFPLVFFLVAVMVSLTSMSRMVENQRTQIGIYKALGYRPAATMTKYLFYAASAGLSGGVIGVVFGSKLFPAIISDAYGHLYNMPPIEMPIPLFIGAIAVVTAVAAVALVTLITCLKSMSGSPALLMRPKPPTDGQRVLLERIPFIWKRLGFFSKVSARNIFRYKKRFLMTLAGVAGCSALLLTAFGLRDSIGSVATLQYGSIMKYETRAYLKDMRTEEQFAGLNALLPAASLYIREEAVTAGGPGGSLPAFLVIPDIPKNLSAYIELASPETGKAVPMGEGSVLITAKLARVMGVGIGDSFTMTLSGGRALNAEVTGIVDNYIQHYVYMSPDA
ncbi:MAG: FtsX-like permease family protein, partial [Clostridiales bacterium]|nr:FtsX-like permease family protein [Clostridiales bacterium]